MKRILLLSLTALAACACGPAVRAPAASSPQDEQINIGYGSIDKQALGYAVDKISIDEQVMSSYTSIAEYLQGRVPGVRVTENGGIQIRGNQTLNGTPSEALIVVDGAIINKAMLKDGSTIQIGTFRMVFHTNRRPVRIDAEV